MLRGPDDRTITVVVQQPSVFDSVKVDVTVDITYTEALALDVQPQAVR